MKNLPYICGATTLLLISFTLVSGAENAQKQLKPVKPPRGAIILFNGKDTSQWEHLGSKKPVEWIVEKGIMEIKPGTGNIVTKNLFSDYKLHVEFMEPLMADKWSQERGNSGVYNLGQYEVQVLDSYNNPTYKAGSCGSIYLFKEPDKNMSKPPLEWQSYDITFTAPRLDAAGKAVANPRITLVWNGEKVHDDVEVPCGPTTASLGGPITQQGPIMLQDHGCKVKYRNIWIQEIKSK